MCVELSDAEFRKQSYLLLDTTDFQTCRASK